MSFHLPFPSTVHSYFPHSTPSFLSVIPDGAFGSIPLGKIDAQTGLGTGFTWRPPVRASSNLIIVGSDARGTGAGGFISSIVSPGNPSRDASGSCPAQAATSTISTPVIVPSTASISYVSFIYF